MPHIVIIIPRFYPLWGGTEIRMRRVAEALILKGYKFSVLTSRFPKTKSYETLVPGLEIYRFPKRTFLFHYNVKKWINHNFKSIDLIHTFRMDKMGLLGSWANVKYGIPHIADIITNEAAKMIANPSKKKKWVRITTNVDALHCLSKGSAGQMLNQGIPGEKIWHRPNAVDIEKFQPAATRNTHEIIKVLFCGRLERQKATDILIKAWRLLPEDVSRKAQLVLAGSGKWEQELRKEAEDMKNILFLGTVKRENIWEQYQQADIYVHPSRFEGMSNAMLEALACGLPIIATTIDGSTDLVEPEVNGLLVPPEDPTALAEALERLMTHPDMRTAMGKHSRMMAETTFSLETLARDYAAEYENLIDRNHGGTALAGS